MGGTIVVDCDPGPDDAANLYLLWRRLRTERILVITSYGSNSLAQTTANIRKFTACLGDELEILHGADQPLLGWGTPSRRQTFFGDDGFNNWSQPLAVSQQSESLKPKTPDSLLERILAGRGEVTYFITGPCTNFAALLACDRARIARHVRQVYVMGGALRTAGNCGPNHPTTSQQVSEFNFYLDPHAAAAVLGSRLPIRLVTWDETKKLTFPRSLVHSIRPGSSAAAIIVDAMRRFFDLYGSDNIPDAEQGPKEPVLAMADVLTALAHFGFGSQQRSRVSIRIEESEFGRSVFHPWGDLIEVFQLDDPAAARQFVIQELEVSGPH